MVNEVYREAFDVSLVVIQPSFLINPLARTNTTRALTYSALPVQLPNRSH